MKPLLRLVVILLLSLTGCGRGLTAGVGVADITPPVGYRMAGYFHERLSTGVHDPLLAKAVYLRQGGTEVALVFCDLCAISPQAAGRARAMAAVRLGIPVDHLTVTATHTHTGPQYYGGRRDRLHTLAVTKHGADPVEEIDYTAFLADRIVRAIATAKRSARPTTLSAGTAQQEDLSFNRRFHMKDGSVIFNPGKLNPDIVRVAGPIDPEVGLVTGKETGGRRQGTEGGEFVLSVFALHLDTVGGTEFSADFPFYLQQSLAADRPGVASIFAPGTCGDINHVDVSREGRQHGQEEARRIGQALATTVKAAMPSLVPLERPSLAMLSEKVSVPLQRYGPDKLAWAHETVERPNVPFLTLVEACKVLELDRIGSPTTLDMEVQALRIDPDTALVFLPGEVFVEMGLAIKERSPFKHTFVVELTNDTPFYIPTRKAFDEGSYETINSWVQPGGGEMLVEAAVELLNELKR